MPDMSKFPKIPTFKRDLIALWKGFGPGWMLAALALITLPWTLAGAGYCISAIAELVKVLR
jgi:hypothetical protein